MGCGGSGHKRRGWRRRRRRACLRPSWRRRTHTGATTVTCRRRSTMARCGPAASSATRPVHLPRAPRPTTPRYWRTHTYRGQPHTHIHIHTCAMGDATCVFGLRRKGEGERSGWRGGCSLGSGWSSMSRAMWHCASLSFRIMRWWRRTCTRSSGQWPRCWASSCATPRSGPTFPSTPFLLSSVRAQHTHHALQPCQLTDACS
jgi:hypothetical protein